MSRGRRYTPEIKRQAFDRYYRKLRKSNRAWIRKMQIKKGIDRAKFGREIIIGGI